VEPADKVIEQGEVFVDFKRSKVFHKLNIHPHSIERNLVVSEVLNKCLHFQGVVHVSCNHMPAESPLWSSDWFSDQVMVLLNNFCRCSSKHDVKVANTSICLTCNIYLTVSGLVFQCPLLSSCDVGVNTKPRVIFRLSYVERLNRVHTLGLRVLNVSPPCPEIVGAIIYGEKLIRLLPKETQNSFSTTSFLVACFRVEEVHVVCNNESVQLPDHVFIAVQDSYRHSSSLVLHVREMANN
jgi:hypothetical protein